MSQRNFWCCCISDALYRKTMNLGQYGCHGCLGSTGATGAWAPVKSLQRVPGTRPEKEVGFKRPTLSKNQLMYITQKMQPNPSTFHLFFGKNGERSQNFWTRHPSPESLVKVHGSKIVMHTSGVWCGSKPRIYARSGYFLVSTKVYVISIKSWITNLLQVSHT